MFNGIKIFSFCFFVILPITAKAYEQGIGTYGNPTVQWGQDSELKIGKYCSIAINMNMILGRNHRTD